MVRRIDGAGAASVAELARTYGVSAVTIHRDLETLVAEGEVERIRGGARSLSPPTGGPRRDFDRRRGQDSVAKRKIAACAVSLCNEVSTIFLDASTTCLALARELERVGPPQLTVVTNSPAIACELNAPAIHLIVPPGEVDQNMLLIGGRWTVEFLAELNLERAFISRAGLTVEHGLTTGQRSIADVLRAATVQARETIALVDASKIGTHSLLTIVPLRSINKLIVDDGVSADQLAELERAWTSVSVADGDAGDLRPSTVPSADVSR